jgi:tetratricopeptide (TPR) repeat protein
MPKKPKIAKIASPRRTRGKSSSKTAKTKTKLLKSKKPTPKAAKRKAPAGRSLLATAKPAPRVLAPPPRAPSKQFAGAVAALEAGIKLMYAEDYAKAIKAFNKVIQDYPDEPEILVSARARIQACEKKLQERSRTTYKTPDDHYNVAVAMLNAGEIDSAIDHLQSALKLAPKADHILYAMAAANALKGNKDQALSYLKQSIHHRPENRFQASQDTDFAVLVEEQAFKDLVAPPEK